MLIYQSKIIQGVISVSYMLNKYNYRILFYWCLTITYHVKTLTIKFCNNKALYHWWQWYYSWNFYFKSSSSKVGLKIRKKWCIICLSYSKHIKEDPKVQHRWKQNVVLTSLITWSDSHLTFCFCMSNTLH